MSQYKERKATAQQEVLILNTRDKEILKVQILQRIKNLTMKRNQSILKVNLT